MYMWYIQKISECHDVIRLRSLYYYLLMINSIYA